MRFVQLFFVLFFSFLISSFNNPWIKSECDKIPPLNQEVVNFVKSKISKKVGRGECWDLAAEALNSVNATWDMKYNFGREVNPGECVFPGDIMQFEGVELRYKKGNMFFVEKMDHHTAIIYQVKEKDNFIIADQNSGNSGRKVGLGPLELPNITKGSYKIYRPVK